MNQRRVLIIDDQKNIDIMVRDGLLYYPVEMMFSTGQQDAIKQILKDPPDLMVSGMTFADGNALALLQELKHIVKTPPAGIFLTTDADAEAQKEILKMGAVDVLARPFEMPQLHRKIDHAVRVMKAYRVPSRLERFVQNGAPAFDFEQLVEESKSLGIPVAELIKLKQLSI